MPLCDPPVTWTRSIRWAAVVIATLAFAAAPDFVKQTEPQDAIVLDHAVYEFGSEDGREVALPHAMYPQLSQSATARYRIHFELSAVPDDGLFLYIPTLNRHISLALNGETLFDSVSTALWTGPVSNTSDLVHLPRPVLIAGRNQLAIIFQVGRSVTPTYLSRLYLGSEASLAPLFKWRLFLDEHVKSIGFGAHILTGIGLILVYFMRRQDTMFSWLAALSVVTFISATGNLLGFQPGFELACRI